MWMALCKPHQAVMQEFRHQSTVRHEQQSLLAALPHMSQEGIVGPLCVHCLSHSLQGSSRNMLL